MVRKVARAGDGGVVAGGAARAACDLESQARANVVAEVCPAKPAQTAWEDLGRLEREVWRELTQPSTPFANSLGAVSRNRSPQWAVN